MEDAWWRVNSSVPPDACFITTVELANTNASCITDGPGDHSTEESCTFIAKQDMHATATEYDVERSLGITWDYIRINGTKFNGGTPPPTSS